MTEEKLVERVTALFADSDAAQRKMIRLYAETNDAIEVYIAVCDRQACSLGELCTKAGEPFGVNGPAVRSALERLNARLYKSNTPAYQMLCERNGKTPQDRLTVSELLEAVIARTHHDLRC